MDKSKILTIIGLIAIIWVAVAVIGLVVKGLIWLFIIGLILFALTALFGGARSRR